MYKLTKWAFDMGVKYERRRIRQLIAELRINSRPEKPDDLANSEVAREAYQKQMSVFYQVEGILNRLTNPQYLETPNSLLDEEL